MSPDDHDTSRRWLAALAAAGDVAYDWDLASDALTWGGAAAALLELAPEAVPATGRALAERINPDDLARRRQRLDEHLAAAVPFACEYRVRSGGERFIWIEDRGAAEHDAAGHPQRMRGILRSITERKAEAQRRELFASFDELTGHYNRARLRDVLDHIVAASLRSGNPGAYLVIGIDRLAALAAEHGPAAAEAALLGVAQMLERELRVSDMIGRVGEDRFGVVLADCGPAAVAAAARRLAAALRHTPIAGPAGPLAVRVSIGSAGFPEPAKTFHEAMQRAEQSMEEAVAAGGDRIFAYVPSEEQRRRQHSGMALGDRVIRAMREDRLVFAFQPVVDAVTGTVDYHEAMLRMIGEDGRIIVAADFIPAIEPLGFMRLIDRYVLDKAIDEVAAEPGIVLGFNISGLTTSDRSWLRAAVARLRHQPNLARRLVIEITETAALHDIEDAARFVGVLRDLGCRVALDDVGAGFTALQHLQALAVDTVKIDGSVVAALCENSDEPLFLRRLVGLARSLGLRTIAEGVETAPVAAALRREGVTVMQGYLLGQLTLERPWLADAQPRRAVAGSLTLNGR